jgi:pSer/pThr/pTyr-binding forkhead associated (FHA) protein
MPYLQINEKRFPLAVGDVSVGTGAGARIRVEGPEEAGVQAVVQVSPQGHVAIRRVAAAAQVRVNGVQLGAEPTPLIHGDKIEVGGAELFYGDDKKGGSTQFITDVDIPALQSHRDPAPGRATATTGGRLVSLVDGREYMVPQTGLVIGRDAGCDVVVPGSDVSRRHAEIAVSQNGYVVSDTSTNGVFVNGERVSQSRVLGRGDIVRVGNEEFRFYADVPAPDVLGATPAPPPEPAAKARAAQAPAGKAAASAPDMAGGVTPAAPTPAAPAPTPFGGKPAPKPPVRPPAPATPAAPGGAPGAAPAPAAAPAPRPLLATLEIVNEGVLKGRCFELRAALTHVGRGAHNDVVIADESVSDTHAKIQRREGGWYVVDMGSTNGTYVGGRRITAEQAISGSSDLRFGGIKMQFKPAADARDEAKGTRIIAGVSAEQARQRSAPAPALAPAPEPEARTGLPAWIWILVAALLVVTAFFFLQGRS